MIDTAGVGLNVNPAPVLWRDPVIGACKSRHRATEFRAFLDQVEAAVPANLDVHLVLDNAAPSDAVPAAAPPKP